MKTTIYWSAALAALLVAGCGGQRGNETPQTTTESHAEAPVTPPTGAGHAGANVVPGSDEDWCAEHEVAETQCTRCDPSLIPAFQASGDWDAEHGLPMSQCKIHDPNLKIVRPPKPEGS
jgi:hypothetical protein